MLLQILKWFFPEPLKDAKGILVIIISGYAVYSMATEYADKQTVQVKEQLIQKESIVQASINKNHQNLMAYLRVLKDQQKELNVDLKQAIQINSNKLWELSRSINQ